MVLVGFRIMAADSTWVRRTAGSSVSVAVSSMELQYCTGPNGPRATASNLICLRWFSFLFWVTACTGPVLNRCRGSVRPGEEPQHRIFRIGRVTDPDLFTSCLEETNTGKRMMSLRFHTSNIYQGSIDVRSLWDGSDRSISNQSEGLNLRFQFLCHE